MSELGKVWIGYCIGFGEIPHVKPDDFVGMEDALMLTAYALGRDDARRERVMSLPDQILKRVKYMLEPQPAEEVTPAGPSELEKAAQRLHLLREALLAIRQTVDDPHLSTGDTYDLIRKALVSVGA